ncbi:MAG: hypothetical protein QOD92_1510 [Acidimicrobiaceae bacterium]|jgi:DNA-binding NarL/FixJ family response regulator
MLLLPTSASEALEFVATATPRRDDPAMDEALRLLRAALGRPAPAALQKLTTAERRVAAVVGRGATNREAATSLYISLKTVEFHLQRIYRKLEVRSRTELAALLHSDPAALLQAS